MDVNTGKPISGFASVEQRMQKLLSTGLGGRIMREWVGNPGTRLIGENATERNLLSWASIVWTLVELYEPQFSIKNFELASVERAGVLDLVMVGEYLPYGHQNWLQAKYFISVVDGDVSVKLAT